jgi:hypothetical protein
MEGGMGSVGPFANPVVAVLALLVVPALAVLAIYRGARARRDRADGLTLARTRRVYFCFAGWGAFVFLAAAVAIVSEPYLEVVGILGAIPVAIAAPVGLFHALMVWRTRSIQILSLATVLAFAAVAAVPTGWSAVIAAGYGLGVIVASVLGIRRLHRGTAS